MGWLNDREVLSNWGKIFRVWEKDCRFWDNKLIIRVVKIYERI